MMRVDRGEHGARRRPRRCVPNGPNSTSSPSRGGRVDRGLDVRPGCSLHERLDGEFDAQGHARHPTAGRAPYVRPCRPTSGRAPTAGRATPPPGVGAYVPCSCATDRRRRRRRAAGRRARRPRRSGRRGRGPPSAARRRRRRSSTATGCLVVPGGVDVHTHLHLPVGAVRVSDDFDTGTIAAAIGGTTTIVDYVTAYRGEDPLDALATWRRLGRARVRRLRPAHDVHRARCRRRRSPTASRRASRRSSSTWRTRSCCRSTTT